MSGQPLAGTPGTVWLTGLSGAGKTTIAEALADRLRAHGERVEVLDGDELRAALSAGLGFSRADRSTHVRRVGFLADLLARNGVWAIVPVIAPYADDRSANRVRHGRSGSRYVEVHVATSLDECGRRDVKGLYAKARAGKITGMTGLDDPYEVPEQPELVLTTEGRSVDAVVVELVAALVGADDDTEVSMAVGSSTRHEPPAKQPPSSKNEGDGA